VFGAVIVLALVFCVSLTHVENRDLHVLAGVFRSERYSAAAVGDGLDDLVFPYLDVHVLLTARALIKVVGRTWDFAHKHYTAQTTLLMDVNLEIDGISKITAELDEIGDDWSGGGGWRVVNPVDYAAIIEFGRGPVTPTNADVLRFEAGGEVVYTMRSGPVAPQPMIRPAVDETKRQVGAIARSSGNLDDFLQRMAFAIEGAAARRTPVDTGNLRSAWSSRPL
jgi:hypothetical protein